MKPIEEGCTAIVTGDSDSPNTGKIVQVGKFIGQPPPVETSYGVRKVSVDNIWEVSQNMEFSDKNGTAYYLKMMVHDRLQRLDDTEENDLVKHEIEERV